MMFPILSPAAQLTVGYPADGAVLIADGPSGRTRHVDTFQQGHVTVCPVYRHIVQLGVVATDHPVARPLGATRPLRLPPVPLQVVNGPLNFSDLLVVFLVFPPRNLLSRVVELNHPVVVHPIFDIRPFGSERAGLGISAKQLALRHDARLVWVMLDRVQGSIRFGVGYQGTEKAFLSGKFKKFKNYSILWQKWEIPSLRGIFTKIRT